MSQEIDCRLHCNAACCKFAKYLHFPDAEAQLLIDAGTNLTPMGDVDKRDGGRGSHNSFF